MVSIVILLNFSSQTNLHLRIRPIYSDRELLHKLRNGDSIAFNFIYNIYAAPLLIKLKRLIKFEPAIEEIHQDIFVRLWNARENLDEETNLQAYLHTIARNLTINWYKKASRDKELSRQIEYSMDLAYDHIEPLLAYKETAEILEQMISLLPPQRQKVFRMIKIEGKSYQETSNHFGVSISTVKDHMAKSADFLKQKLANKYPALIGGILACYQIFK